MIDIQKLHIRVSNSSENRSKDDEKTAETRHTEETQKGQKKDETINIVQ